MQIEKLKKMKKYKKRLFIGIFEPFMQKLVSSVSYDFIAF